MADDFFLVKKGITFRGYTMPSNPVDGDVYFDSIQGFLGYQNGSWGPLGGSGTINYDTNPSVGSTNGYNLYNNGAVHTPTTGTGGSATGLALTSTQTNPLVGHTMGVLAKSAVNAQGQGFSYDFQSDLAFSPGVIKVSFQYQASANFQLSDGSFGSDSDIEMWVYDITNAVLIPVTPNVFIGGVATPATFTGYFQTNYNSTHYRVIWHVATTNALAWTFDFANVSISPVPAIPQASPIVAAIYNSTTVQGPTGQLFFENKVIDNYNAVNNPGSAWQFVAPVAGVYAVNVSQYTGSSRSDGQNELFLNLNGSAIAEDIWANGGQPGIVAISTRIATHVNMKVGDYLTVTVGNTFTTDGSASGNQVSVVLQAPAAMDVGLNIPIKSLPTGAFSTNNTASPGVPITDSGGVNPIQCVITTQGQAVKIGFEPDPGSGGTNESMIQVYRNTGLVAYAAIQIYRDGTPICTMLAGQQNNIAVGITGFPPGSFSFTDTPPAGTHTYTANAWYVSSSAPTAPSGVNVYYSVLVATIIAGISPSAVPASLVSRIKKSNSTGSGFGFSTSLVPVTDLSAVPLTSTVVCNGGDVEIGFMDDGTTNPGRIRTARTGAPVNCWPQVYVQLYRDGVCISVQAMMTGNNTGYETAAWTPASVRFIDTPPVGTHTYSVQVYNQNQDGGNAASSTIEYTVLYARPLA